MVLAFSQALTDECSSGKAKNLDTLRLPLSCISLACNACKSTWGEHEKIAFVVVGVLALLLFSNMIVLAAGAPDNDQKIVIPNEWHGKNKIVIPHGDLVQVVYIKRTDDSTVATNDPTLAYGDPWTGTDLFSNKHYLNGYDVADWHWVLSKSQNPKGVKYIINPSTAVSTYGLTPPAVVSAIQNSF